MSATWRPTEGKPVPPWKLEAGMVIAVNAHTFRFKPWRVHEVLERDDEGDDRIHVVLRPVGELFDFAEHNHPVTIRRYAVLYRLPDHYSLCHLCGEIAPCSHVWIDELSAAEAERTARYEVAGVCPSCGEPITRRQDVHSFDENLYVPLGPPVTFHARQKCAGGAVAYDELLAKKNDTQARLSCEGLITHHLDGERVCTNITCPSSHVRHRSMAMCYVLDAKCNRPECWSLEDRIPGRYARREGQ